MGYRILFLTCPKGKWFFWGKIQNTEEFKFYVKPYFLGELETPSISNWNLEMPFFEETRKLGYMEKKYLQTEITSQKLTASLAWVWHRLRDVNPGHTGGRQSDTQSLLAFWSVIPVVTLLTKKPEDSGTGTRLGGRLLLHLFISPAHHSRNSRASGEGDGEAPPPTPPPPTPLPFHNVLNLMHGQETI